MSNRLSDYDWYWVHEAYVSEVRWPGWGILEPGVIFVHNPEHRRTLEAAGLMIPYKAKGKGHLSSKSLMRLTDAGRKRGKEIDEQLYPPEQQHRRGSKAKSKLKIVETV